MAAAQQTKKLFKDIAEAMMLILGTSDLPEEASKAMLDKEDATSYPNGDAFAEAAIAASADEALTLQRALAYKMDSADPIIDCESFLEKSQLGLPDLVGMQVQRGLGKAGGIGCKQCQLSAFCPHLRDMAKKITHATFMKEIFKAYKGAPVKKAPPPPPTTGGAKKFFGKKKEEEAASPAAATEGGDATVVSSTKKTFGKKATTTPAAGDMGSPTSTSSEQQQPAATGGGDGSPETVVATKKTFFGKKKSQNSTPASEIENNNNQASPIQPSTTSESLIADNNNNNGGESGAQVVTATKKTFGKKKVASDEPETATTTEASPPPAPAAEKKEGGEGETVVATKKTFFGKKKQTPTTSELPSEAASRSQSNLNLADSQNFGGSQHIPPPAPPPQEQQQESTPTRRAFGNKTTSSSPGTTASATTTTTTNRSPPQQQQQQMYHPTPTSNHYANTMSPRPTVVSETSASGAVITPRCPECATRFLIKKEDASCQTDWGARFITAREAEESSKEGRVQKLLRNDISSALEEAQNKANQLLEMKKQFVEARMKALSDQEAAILQGLPANDRERLTILQNSIAVPSYQQQQNQSSATVDYLRLARSAASNNRTASAFTPNDAEEVARLREGAQMRLRALAEEESHIKAQLELMESNRHQDLEAAAQGRALLMTEKVNANVSATPLSQWNSASPNRSYSQTTTNGSPGKRMKRW